MKDKNVERVYDLADQLHMSYVHSQEEIFKLKKDHRIKERHFELEASRRMEIIDDLSQKIIELDCLVLLYEFTSQPK